MSEAVATLLREACDLERQADALFARAIELRRQAAEMEKRDD